MMETETQLETLSIAQPDNEKLNNEEEQKRLNEILRIDESTLAELECLDLSSNDLSTVPTEIFNLKYLTKLVLNNNKLKVLPGDISSLTNLLFLDLSKNQLSTLPKTLAKAERLKFLDLSSNIYSEVPEVLYSGLRSLRVLNMYDNYIEDFNLPPGCSVTLINLNLRKNNLLKVPHWIFSNESCLEAVDLSENPVVESMAITLANVCSKGSFETIKEIKLINTNLSSEKMEFLSHLKKLEIVHIGNLCFENNKNFLEDFKTSVFKNLNSLKELNIEYGNMASLPTDFGEIKKIEILNLSNNCLSWLPDSFVQLELLVTCDLTNNTLSYLPANIGNLINLKEFYLGHNQLSDLPESFTSLINLEILDLYDNRIESIDFEFLKKLNLKGLDLERNYLDEENLESKMKTKYEELKCAIRKLIEMGENRLVGQKEICSNETTDDQEDLESFRSFSSHEDENQDGDAQYGESWDEERWDVEDGPAEVAAPVAPDDFFDPNDIPDLSHHLTFKQRKEKELFKNNYCPADNHVQPVMSLFLKKNKTEKIAPEPYEEGQFDSD